MTSGPASSRSSLPRLAIVLSHATQYYSPWFRWLKTNTELPFRVFYLSEFGLKPAHDEKFQTSFAWDVDLTTGYDWEPVPNTAGNPDTLRYDGLRNPSLWRRLKVWRPDAILLFGYNYHTHVRLIARARLHRIPLIFRGDSHLIGRTQSFGAIKRHLLSFLYRQFSAVTYVGQANRDYFKALNVPDERLFFSPHSVNAAHFNASSALQANVSNLRASLGLEPTTRIVLFAGKFIAQKQPIALLEAFLFAMIPNTALVFVGDGPEKSALHARVAAQSGARVHFLPFANQSEMPTRYALADLFVLPSLGTYETWGLAVNEAMHMGVPCLVSDHVGCQRDLVTDGETGWVFPARDAQALAEKLKVALNTLEHDSATIRRAVRQRIESYTYAKTTTGLLNALKAVVSPHA